MIATGGGTGGHVYPALSILEALRARLATAGGELQVLYVGSKGGLEEDIVSRAGISFSAVPAGAVLGRSPFAIAASMGRIAAGFLASLRVMLSFRPKVVLATGGYVCVPVVLAAALARIPSLIFLPDVKPGLAVRFLSRFAQRVAVTMPESQSALPAGKVVVTGYPVRPEIFAAESIESRHKLGLSPNLPVVLVLGGSRGAQSINEAIMASLPALLAACQVVHAAGATNEEALRLAALGLPAELRDRYHLYPYLHAELPLALAAADIVVSRSGASVMGEYPAVGAASVLIPYPHAGAHQRLNANQLVARGAAVEIDDGALPSGVLGRTVLDLLNDEGRLAGMRAAARELARPQARDEIAGLIEELAYRHPRTRRMDGEHAAKR
jgi:UDP-N-acetylglucosamine--N-acetylmuramyl-(pentapeptide) pyrophosphoryl-undecaprenol N-acetylglucosamine transferase